jgi:glucose-fructose oxidoreductase
MSLLGKLFSSKSTPEAVRYAVVGLGHFAQTAVLPAFANAADTAKLAALVTGDVEKAAKLGRKYDVPTWDYESFGALLESGSIDAVYIATPNSEHRKYTELAAKAGIHVLCEKPLAHSVDDARAMVEACDRAKVLLMTAYRLHFEEANLNTVETVRAGKIGDPRVFVSTHTMQVDPENVRTDLDLGGGPLEDIGVYCLNAARYIFRDEPEQVAAFAVHGTDRRFREVPETVSVMMRFPKGRLASFVCGFGQTKLSEYRVIGTEGMITMDPGYTWQGEIRQTISKQSTSASKEKTQSKVFDRHDQVAAELAYFSDCIRSNKKPEPSGREGLIDVRIIDALRRSYAANGRPITIKNLKKSRRPHGGQTIKRGPGKKPKPVKAKEPARG